MTDSASVVGITPGDSSVMTGYQVDEFTHPLSAEYLVAKSHIYLMVTGIVSTLADFAFESGCEGYSFWTKQLQALSMVLIHPHLYETGIATSLSS